MSTAKVRRLERQAGALLYGPVSKGKRPADLTKWANDPLGFITTILRAQPRGKQLDVIQALRDHRQIVVPGCHGSGKDYIAARICLFWVYALGGRVIVTGPTQRQIVDIVFAELRRAMRDEAAVQLFGELYQSELWLDGEPHAGITGLVSSQDARLTGLHAPKTLVLITEAQGVGDWAFEALEGNALDPDDRILALGNTLASSTGWFRRACFQNSGWHRVQITARDIFEAGINVPGGTRIPGMITPEWVEQKRREYGERSPFYVSKVLAEFPDAAGENAITTRKLLDDAAKRYGNSPRIINAPWGLGVDVGREGDPSAICWHQGAFFHGVETEPTPTGRDAADFIQRKAAQLESDPFGLGRFPVNSIIIDAIGVGASAVDVLTDRNIPHVEFKSNAKATDEHYANCRAEAYHTLAKLLEKGEIAIAYDAELWEELLALTWFANSKGQVQMLDKRDVRSLLGRSPNKADALAMAVYEIETGAGIGGSIISF